MTHDEREVAAIAELAHLPADDPRVTAAMASPRTRALLVAYRDFHAGTVAPEGARVADADAALAAMLERELAPPGAAPASTPRGASGGGFWARLFAPALRPAWAMAALVLVALLAWQAMPGRGPAPGRVLRGEVTTALSAQAQVVAGGTTFSWAPLAGADRYEVRLYAADLVTVLAVHEVRDGTNWTLPAAEYPEPIAHGDGAAWQVSAYGGDELLAQSAMGTLAGR